MVRRSGDGHVVELVKRFDRSHRYSSINLFKVCASRNVDFCNKNPIIEGCMCDNASFTDSHVNVLARHSLLRYTGARRNCLTGFFVTGA